MTLHWMEWDWSTLCIQLEFQLDGAPSYHHRSHLVQFHPLVYHRRSRGIPVKRTVICFSSLSYFLYQMRDKRLSFFLILFLGNRPLQDFKKFRQWDAMDASCPLDSHRLCRQPAQRIARHAPDAKYFHYIRYVAVLLQNGRDARVLGGLPLRTP